MHARKYHVNIEGEVGASHKTGLIVNNQNILTMNVQDIMAGA